MRLTGNHPLESRGKHFKNIREENSFYNERKAIFMMFREVEKNIENEKINKNEEESYKKIKPETDMTFEEAEAFWNEIFVNLAKES